MRILHVDSARGWRGGQNQVLLTAQGMAGRGHEVLLAVRAGASLYERARAAGLDARGLAFRGEVSLTAALALRRLVRRFRPDVVHAHDPHAAAASVLLPSSVPIVASRRGTQTLVPDGGKSTADMDITPLAMTAA